MSSETSEQIKVFSWASRFPFGNGMLGHYMFAIPNEGKRTKKMGGRLKAQGLRSGVPDFMVAIPCGGYHGLFVEMKYGKNGLSENQTKWIARLERQGFKVGAAWSSEEAKELILNYLGGANVGICES